MYEQQLNQKSAEYDQSGAIGYLTEHGLGKDDAVKYRLGFVGVPLPGDEPFTGTLAIPYLTPAGPRAVKFRRLSGRQKYMQHAGQTPRLYNTSAYFEAYSTIGLCEGEIDAIAATEHLGVPSIGIPGSDMWGNKRDIWGPLFKDFRQVIVFADGDDAGTKLATQVAATLGWRAHIVQCPEGEDVASMVAAGRAAELRKRFERVTAQGGE